MTGHVDRVAGFKAPGHPSTTMTEDALANLDAVMDTLETRLDARYEAREAAHEESRTLVRKARELAGAIHRGDDTAAREQELLDDANTLQERLRDAHPDLLQAGFVRNAHQEVAQVTALACIARDDPLPSPDEIPVTPEGYLLGLGDLAGELRRLTQNALQDDDLASAQHRLHQLDDLHHALQRFDYPGGFLQVEPTQDTTRDILARTRGDVTTAIQRARLQDTLGDVGHLLDHLEEPPEDRDGEPTTRERAPGDDVDLDIDSVW